MQTCEAKLSGGTEEMVGSLGGQQGVQDTACFITLSFHNVILRHFILAARAAGHTASAELPPSTPLPTPSR